VHQARRRKKQQKQAISTPSTSVLSVSQVSAWSMAAGPQARRSPLLPLVAKLPTSSSLVGGFGGLEDCLVGWWLVVRSLRCVWSGASEAGPAVALSIWISNWPNEVYAISVDRSDLPDDDDDRVEGGGWNGDG